MAEASFGESAQFNNVAATSSKGLRDSLYNTSPDTTSELTKIARVLVRFDHVASFIENANHYVVGAAAVHRVADRVADRIWLAIPQATKRQHIRN